MFYRVKTKDYRLDINITYTQNRSVSNVNDKSTIPLFSVKEILENIEKDKGNILNKSNNNIIINVDINSAITKGKLS